MEENNSFEPPSTDIELANTLMDKCYMALKTYSKFPHDTGHLQDEALDKIRTENGFNLFLHNSDVNKGAPYQYFLEYGTQPHIIHNAFGKFTVKHPGSRKHVGFWSSKSYMVVIAEILEHVKAELNCLV